ncbi:hypothetical protein BH10ACI3_BH10ACI3_20060 [soil metagenome]
MQPAVLGEWKAIRDYDFFHKEWQPAREDVTLVLLSDGHYRIVKLGSDDKTGTFDFDGTAEPKRIVLTEDGDGIVARGIYKIDGDKLTMRASDKPDVTEFPTSFDPNDDDARLALIEFQRK